MKQPIKVTLIKGVSKKGKEYKALSVTVGEYKGMIFPSPIECHYIEAILTGNAHREFKDSVDDDLAFEDLDGDTN